MLYQAYQAHADIMGPVRAAGGHRGACDRPSCDRRRPATASVRNLTAAYELIARAGLTHTRPPFGIDSVMVGNREVEVREEAAHVTPFGTLLHFKKDIDAAQPRVLLVAPLSGHFATLLRGTVRTMLPEHDVYITDWHNMRDVDAPARPLRLRRIHRAPDQLPRSDRARARMSSRCASPASPALVATAVMAQDNHPAQPRSLTLMAGPIDTRVNPTKVNELANSKTDRLVRAEPDRARAVPLRRRGPPGLSGLRAARRLHEHEHRAPREGAPDALRAV